jgi:hypothetical protein
MILISGAMALGIGLVVFFFDPTKNHFYPICLFHKYTGLECPGCGATRALYALLHGNVPLALHDNALLVALILLSVVRGGWLLVEKIRGQEGPAFFSPRFLWPLLVAGVIFGVMRNLPWFSFLSPD